MLTIGERIRKTRKARKMTLEELAVSVGTSKHTIQRYETGIISNIPSDKIEKISETLSVSPGYLMGWEEQKNEVRKTFNYNLKELMSKYKKNADEIASSINVDTTQVNLWISGEDIPTVHEINLLANYFNVPADKFNDKKDSSKTFDVSLSYEEKQIIDMYRSMSEGNKEAVFTLMKNLSHPL